MKALGSTVTAASVGMLLVDVAHAGAPDHLKLFGIPVMYWILIIVILLIFNLLCCWMKR
jgi:hypothetical protein